MIKGSVNVTITQFNQNNYKLELTGSPGGPTGPTAPGSPGGPCKTTEKQIFGDGNEC